MHTSPFLLVHESCDAAWQWADQQLIKAGLRPVQTFDLHSARDRLGGCSCPNHGTHACDCQIVVALVYGQGEEPVTLFLHGNDGQTWLSTADDLPQRLNTRLCDEIKQALEKVPISIS
jgi:hypothetical protein